MRLHTASWEPAEGWSSPLLLDSMTVAIATFDTTRISAVHERVGSPGESYDAGVTLGKRLMECEPETVAPGISDPRNQSITVATFGESTYADV